MRVKDTASFIKKARQVHGDKYDYSKTLWVKSSKKVTIICPVHGEFEKTPSEHTYKKETCRKCYDGQRGQKKLLNNKAAFEQKARMIHGNKYDYSKVDYQGTKQKVIIICPIHGEFEKTPANHCSKEYPVLNKHPQGCGFCSNEKLSKERIHSISQFINKARMMHDNKYDYSKVDYQGAKEKVIITCPKHGNFKQTPNDHLNQKSGCPRCKSSKGEKLLAKVLADQRIIFETEKTFPTCKNKKVLPFDIFVPHKKLLIEYDGEHHFGLGIFAKPSVKKNDAIKTKWAADNGYALLRIPYTAKTEQQILSYLSPYL